MDSSFKEHESAFLGEESLSANSSIDSSAASGSGIDKFSSGLTFSSSFWMFLLGIHVFGFILALPPFGVTPLLFFSLGAISLAVLPEKLPGRRPYLALWGAGTIFWLYVVHFVRYPHWINYGLWCLLAGYLGCYLPIFAAVSRKLIFQRIPKLSFRILGNRIHSSFFHSLVILAVLPIIWAACDILRGWVFSGMTMASAADVFFREPIMLQTADIWGQWGVSSFFVFLSVAGMLACLGICPEGWYFRSQRFSSEDRDENCSRKFQLKFSWLAGITALIAGWTFLLGYGFWRLGQENSNLPAGKFVLLQGCVPAELETTPELIQKTETVYLRLLEDVRNGQDVNTFQESEEKISLVVYPESIYREPIVFSEKDAFQPKDLVDQDGLPIAPEDFQVRLEEVAEQTQEEILNFTRYVVQAPFLAGCSTFYYRKKGIESHNSAIFITPETEKIDPESAYHKMILVPFGEYVPMVRTLRRWFPWIESLLPIMSQDAGKEPLVISVEVEGGERLHGSLSICFESLLPRLIRRQLVFSRQNGTEADFLISLTNNGWFGRSHEGILYLACCVLRTIENRKPLLIAANYGISASIDSDGYVQKEIPTGTEGILITKIRKDSRRTFFTAWGGLLLWGPLGVFGGGIPFPKKRRQGDRPDWKRSFCGDSHD